LTLEEIPTPLFESIYAPQKWSKEMVDWMFVFLGRLFYAVGEKDDWQVIPFLLGAAGTGKSTTIKIIQLLYNARDVGVINNNVETKFGLSQLFDKTVFVAPEVKKNFCLDQAEMQSMISGEEMSLAVKNSDAKVGTWTVPGIICGNELPSWADSSGSIARRVVIFDFPNKIDADSIDMKLLNKIKDLELPAIIRRASLSYLRAVENHGKKDVWTALPDRMLENKKKLMYSTNVLYSFLSSTSIELGPEMYTLESVFIVALKAFASLKFPRVSITFTEEFYGFIFSDFGLTVETCLREWPPHSNNLQKDSYIMGCKIE